MEFTLLESLSFVAPELVLIATIVLILALDRVLTDADRLGDIALGGIALAFVAMALVPHELSGWLFGRALAHDPFASFFKALFALATMITAWMSLGSAEVRRMSQANYYALLLAGMVGMCGMAAAGNLAVAYVSFEILSLASYGITGFVHDDRRSKEAALKFLLYGGVASALMLYGMSWTYGLTGSVDFAEIRAALAGEAPDAVPLAIALLLMLAGMGFKISMMPFHMWAPDVFSGSPIPVAAFLSVGAKAAGFALLIRVAFPTFSELLADGQWYSLAGVDGPRLLAAFAIASMTLGNLAALRQQGIKRMLAYSGVAHAGYLLMGLASASQQGLEAAMFYLVAYAFMNFGVFAVLLVVHNATGHADLAALRGLAGRGGALPAAAMVVFLFSLIGLPPFVGFFAKLYLFAAVIEQKMYVLAVAGAANTVVSVGYYFQVVRTIAIEAPPADAHEIPLAIHDRMLIVLLLAGTSVLGLASGPLLAFCRYSLEFLLD